MKQGQAVILYFISLCIGCSRSLEKEFTVQIDPSKEDCFFLSAKDGDTLEVEYQVIDGGHGDLDITFSLIDPTKRILVTDFKKSENSHRLNVNLKGDYKFCFDNTFSLYNSKVVFFEIILDEDKSEEDLDQYNFDGFPLDEIYNLKIEDIKNVLDGVKANLNKAKHIQDLIRSTEARDRNLAEETYFEVNMYSIFALFLMGVVGFIQLVMVKSLFDNDSKAHKLWGYFTS